MTCTSCVGFLALCLLSSCAPSLSAYVANKRSAPTESGAKFRLTQVSKENTNNGYLVQLYLEGSEFPKVVFDKNGESSEILPVTSDGVAQFVAGYNESGFFYIYFLHSRGYHAMPISVREDSASLQLIPDIDLSIQGGPEVVFQNDDDYLDLNVSCTVGVVSNITIHPWIGISMYTKSQSERGEVVMQHRTEYSPFSIVDEENSDNIAFTRVRINASRNAEGVLAVQAFYGIECGPKCLVDSYSIVEDVPVYREDHDGPFPDNFIGIIRHYSDEDTSEQFCSLYESHYCNIFCDLVGDHPSPVEIFRVQPTGELAPTPGTSVANNGYRAMGELRLVNYTSADSGEYLCKSRSDQVEFTHTVRVIIGKEARIIDSMTTVKFSEDGSVVATCAAEGEPAPTMAVKVNDDRLMDNADHPNVDVTRTTVDDTIQAVIRITDPRVADNFQYVTCLAENQISGRHFIDSRNLYFV